MDDFSLGPEVIDPILDELEVINKWLGGYQTFYNALGRLNIQPGMTVSDWGCGGGDSLRAIARWAYKKRLDLSFVGVDATPAAIDYAVRRSRRYPEISYLLSDVMSDALADKRYDVIVSSLFTHHFQEPEWIQLVQKMYSCANHAVIINDLHRNWFAYHSIGILTALFSRSELVRHDSRVSVLRGFVRRELESLLQKTGIDNYTIEWKWAFRWQVILYK